MGTCTVVLDTNILISAFGFGGKPDKCFRLGFTDEIELVTSPEALSELERVMEYPHLPFNDKERYYYPKIVRYVCRIVDPAEEINEIDHDPDDDMFLECAVEAGANYIVSGNNHITDLGTFRGIKTLSPHQFLEEIDNS